MAARKVEDDPFAHIGQAEEDPFAHIGAPSPAGQEVLRQGLDVAKQIPSGLIAGVEAIPAFPAQAANLISDFATPYIEKAADWIMPGKAAQMQEADRQRKERLAAFTKLRGGGASDYLPKPETTAGQFARSASEFVPATVAGSTLAIPRAIGVGATAGLVSEGAGQATEGTPAEPFARVGGALIAGTAAARQAERAAAKAALPTIAETKAAGGGQYDQFRQSGFGIDPAAGPQFSGALKADLATRGLTERTVGDTWKVLDNIEAQPFTTPQKFHEAYQELGAVASGAKNSNERLAANIAQERLLGMLERMPPSLITGGDPRAGALLLQQANQNWAAAKRAENVSGRITKAEQVASGQYSGLGLENELRRRMGVLGLPPEATAGRPPSRGFTADERRAFQQFGEGTTPQNIRRYLIGALSGRGGFAAGGALGAGGLATYLGTGDPISGAVVGAGIPAIGTTLALLGNRSALNRARDLERMLLGRSELANRPGRIPQPLPGLPLTTLAPALANLGEGE